MKMNNLSRSVHCPACGYEAGSSGWVVGDHKPSARDLTVLL
jgi:hypothetical protein